MTRSARSARPPFTSVLCPVDFSEHSGSALRYGLAVASRFKAKATALFVNDPLLVAAAATALTPMALEKTSLSELRDFVDRTRKGITGSPAVSCDVTQGDPAAEIDRAVKRRKADLIVVGTHGLSGTRKLVFGSTTARVLREARVPVLAVPASLGGKITDWPGGRVVAAVDLGRHTASDVQAAAKMAEAFDSHLIIVHVMKPLHAPGWLTARTVANDESRLTAARGALEEIARTLDPSLEAECRVVVGKPGEEIPSIAATTRSGLILVTLRAETGWLGTPQGSITYDTLCHATTPVLALPSRAAKARSRAR